MSVALFEGVRDVLQEDETEHDMLIFGSVHVAAHLVGCGPEFSSKPRGTPLVLVVVSRFVRGIKTKLGIVLY